MSENEQRKDDAQVLKGLMAKMKLEAGEKAFAIEANWLDRFKRSSGYDCTATNEDVGPIDNASIVNIYEKQIEKDFYVISFPLWTGLIKLYGGGPEVAVEMGFNPKAGVSVPLVQLHSYKIFYNGRTERVMISKYKKVRCLIDAACEKFGIEDTSKYRLRDYWQHKEGKYLLPDQIICEYSLLVNTEMLLEEGSYDDLKETEETSRSSSKTHSGMKPPLGKMKATFIGVPNQRVLGKPNFKPGASVQRRASQQASAIDKKIHPPLPLPRPKVRANVQDAKPFLFDRTSNPAVDYMSTQRRKTRISEPTLNFGQKPSNKMFDEIKEIANYGNACSFNAVLQCLVHLKPLKDYFMDESSKFDGVPTKAFAEFVRSYYNSGTTTIDPRHLKTFDEKSSPFFNDRNLLDANDLLISILNTLNESMKVRDWHRTMKCTNEAKKADSEWKDHIDNNDTIIAKLFHGQIRTSLVCTNCKKETVELSPFTSIILQLPTPTIITPKFIFVPYNPVLPRCTMKMQIPDKGCYADNFKKTLGEYLGRPVDCLFGIQNSKGAVEWIPGPEASVASSDTLIVYEVPDHNKLYIDVNLVVSTSKFISPMRVVDGPFLVEIPGQRTTQENVCNILNDYFKYLYEPAEDSCVNPEIESLIPFIKSNNDAERKIEVELKKSLFSKTMAFKSLELCPSISSRKVTAIIQVTEGISWPRLSRKTENKALRPKRKEVDLLTLINDAGTPSESATTWKCTECNKYVKPLKSDRIWRLSPILIISLNRFDGSKGSKKKNETPVTYPDVLDLSDVSGRHTYELSAVCEHGGKAGYGHYIAHAKIDKDTWREFGDLNTLECTQEDAHQPNAYILFYTLRDEE